MPWSPVSALRNAAVTLLGAVCFLVGAIALAIHPNHSWHEITGVPEAFPVDSDESVATIFDSDSE